MVYLPKCSECGFAEDEWSLEHDPLNHKYVGPSKLLSIKCHSDPKNQKQITDPRSVRKCKDFVHKIPNFSIKDYHVLKANDIANRKNFRISMFFTTFVLIISLVSLIFGVLIPYFTPSPPEIDLKFQFVAEKMTGPVDYTFSQSFTLYNQGSKICFVKGLSVYELFENGTATKLAENYDARETQINPGETKEFDYQIFNPLKEKTTKLYQIFVFYEPKNYVESPIIAVEWFSYDT